MMINRDYPCNPSNYANQADRTIEYIVIHYVGATGSALENVKYFNRSAGLQASAHFFVGHESEGGAIYQSVDPLSRAWHCGAKVYKHPACRNSNSIGVEMCCHKDAQGNWYFDDVTIEMTVQLVRQLMTEYGIPVDNVIRHYDVTGKLCPAPLTNEFAWLLFKSRLEGPAMNEKTGDNPSSWAIPHTEWAKAKGIINGDGQGNYDWQGITTREAMAAMLHNFAITYGFEKEEKY
ncbi:MAG TPA: peptidoglycan recognition family protein [Spirochaetota bacterium]|nr:peptidoglycan recognition family protein [Spirochaetota bacterium]